MNRFPFIGVALLVPAMALLVLTACSDKKDDKGKTTPTPVDNKEKTVVKVKYQGATDGTISGTIKLKGDAPMINDIAAIGKMENAAEKAVCQQGNQKEQMWIIDKANGVANVIVWLEPADGKEFDIKDSLKEPFKKAVVIEQPHCQYVPHVAAVYAGIQPLVVKSSPNKITHNVKIGETKANKASDDNLVTDAKPVERIFKHDTAMISIACSIHTWMQAKVKTFDHPYFAVSKEDGTFTINNVPSGEDMVLYVWHESMSSAAKHNAAYKVNKGDNKLSLEITSKGEVK